jgi:hypothetical protein
MPVIWPFILVTYIVGAIYEALASTDFDRYMRRLREPKYPAFRQYEKAARSIAAPAHGIRRS